MTQFILYFITSLNELLKYFLLIIEDKGDNNHNYTIDYERNLILSFQLEHFNCEITDFHKIILIIHQSYVHEWKLVHMTKKCAYGAWFSQECTIIDCSPLQYICYIYLRISCFWVRLW